MSFISWTALSASLIAHQPLNSLSVHSFREPFPFVVDPFTDGPLPTGSVEPPVVLDELLMGVGHYARGAGPAGVCWLWTSRTPTASSSVTIRLFSMWS